MIQKNTLRIAALISIAANFYISTATAKPKMPETTHEGLVLVEQGDSVDHVYALPDIDLSVYKNVMLAEPSISFRRNWKQDINRSSSLGRLSDKDVLKLLKKGTELATEAFTKELERGPLPLVSSPGSDVLEIKISITELDIHSPDPDRSAGTWAKVYSEAAGDATLVVELFDSVTGQILVRAIDRKSDIGDEFGWRERTHSSNVRDAKQALNSWARSLSIGLNRALAATRK